MPLHTQEIAVKRRLVFANEDLLESLRVEGEQLLGRRFYRHRVLEMLASYDYDVDRTRIEIRREAREMKREDDRQNRADNRRRKANRTARL